MYSEKYAERRFHPVEDVVIELLRPLSIRNVSIGDISTSKRAVLCIRFV